MKKTLFAFMVFIAFSVIVFLSTSCEDYEDCYTCRIIDPDGILSERGDTCDEDFVDYCKECEYEFYDVTCTCS